MSRLATEHDGPEDSVGFLLWRATLLWQREIRAALAPHELSHVQFVLLVTLSWMQEHGPAPTQAGLAARTATDPMMTSQVLRRLELQGLVTRVEDPGDGRAKRVSATDEGVALASRAVVDVERVDRSFFGRLGARQAAFAAGLSSLTLDEAHATDTD